MCALWPCCSGISLGFSPTPLNLRGNNRARELTTILADNTASDVLCLDQWQQTASSFLFVLPSASPDLSHLCSLFRRRRDCDFVDAVPARYTCLICLLASPRETPTHRVLRPTLLPPLSRTVFFRSEECPYRPCICQYCGHKDTFKAITEGDGSPNHFSGCPNYTP